MKRIVIAIAAFLVLSGCSTLGTFQQVATATVPASAVIPAANAFNILKAGATNYGRYCIQQKMAPAICDASTRRAVIKSVRAGTAARNQLEDSVVNNQPALSSIYNVLVAAVNGLQITPAASTQFTGATQ